jgi:hypothetical protein
MATNIENSFQISENGLSFNDEAMILHGTFDPSLSPGQEAQIGSLYLRTGTPELYQKNGAVDTDWTLVNSVGSGSNNIPVVQLLRSSNQTLTTSYADLNFDITDLETDASILEHDNVNIDRILIKETALYQIQYSLSIDANSGENVFNIRIRINDSTIIPASNREISEDDEINAVTNVFFVLLTAGDYVTLQAKSNGTGDVLWSTANFSISKATAKVGSSGPPGSGSTIIIEDGGTIVPNSPHSTINFGTGIVVNDSASEVEISVPSPIFGSEFQYAESLGTTTTTSSTLQTKVSLNTPVIPAGTYRIGISYGWNFNSTGNDFRGEFHEDNVKIGEEHRQEPKDSSGNFNGTGSNQRHYLSRFVYRTLTTGIHSYDINFRSASSGTSASIWDATIEFWRVS